MLPTMPDSTIPLDPWLQSAFQGNLPDEVRALYKHRETVENVFNEMMTQWPSATREPLEHMRRLHKAETDLLYSVIENLFLRHLDRHP